MRTALEGITVLDLTRLAPGPFGSTFLADLGADVIMIEEPTTARGYRAPQDQATTDLDTKIRRAAFMSYRRNRKSIILNLKAPEGKEIFYKLTKTADALFEGFRPGVTKRLSIDYETVRALNPRIVYCSLSGFGQDGPYVNVVGHDANYQAIGGTLAGMKARDGSFAIPRSFFAADATGGMQCVIGILAALLARQATGRGQYVDVCLLDASVSLLYHETLTGYFSTGQYPHWEEEPPGDSIVFQTKDHRFIALGGAEPWFWENLCRLVELEELIPHQNARGEQGQWVHELLQQRLLTKTRDEWFALMKDKDICAGPVHSIPEVFSDPQVLHRKMVVELDHPKMGKVKQIGMPIKLSDTPCQVRTFGAYPGRDTDEILSNLGYTTHAIAEFRNRKVVE